MTFDYNRLYLTTQGRIGRAEFWTGLLAIAAIVIVVALITVLLAGPVSLVFRLSVFVVELIVAGPTYALFAKRFQDRGRPGITAAVPIAIVVLSALMTLLGWTGSEVVPNLFGLILSVVDLLVCLWIVIDLGILPGTAGPNEYGRDPVGAT